MCQSCHETPVHSIGLMKITFVLALAVFSITVLQAAGFASSTTASSHTPKHLLEQLFAEIEEFSLSPEERQSLETLKYSGFDKLRNKIYFAESDLRNASNKAEPPKPQTRRRFFSCLQAPQVKFTPNPLIADKEAEIVEAQAGINANASTKKSF